MTEFVQQVIGGLASGTVYAALALAIAVVYQGTGMLNFAQGEMAVLAAYVTWALHATGLTYLVVIPLSILLAALVGAGIERTVIRPLEGANPLTLLTMGAALVMTVNALVSVIWGTDPHPFASPWGETLLTAGPFFITSQQLGAVGLVLLTMLVTVGLFRYTSAGLRLRAVAQNRASAQLLGMSPGRWLAAGWAVAGAVGAVAGIVAAPILSISPQMMLSPLLMALAAVTLGGFTSRVGAVVGGLTIGVLSNLASRYVPGLGGDLNIVIPFIVIFLVLLLKPSGLFSRASAVRA